MLFSGLIAKIEVKKRRNKDEFGENGELETVN